ncbi:MAG TPA: hypothetical protein DDZ82_01680, partial [Rhodobacteraceae bacterium]|nr:hypothetical protein [Paracoccaceae bacterium]
MLGCILWHPINANTYGKNVAYITSDLRCQMMCSSIKNSSNNDLFEDEEQIRSSQSKLINSQ